MIRNKGSAFDSVVMIVRDPDDNAPCRGSESDGITMGEVTSY